MCFKQKVGFLLLIGTLLLLASSFAGTVAATSGGADSDDVHDTEALNDRINDTAELPDIHENTIIYNGVIDPDFILRVEMPRQEEFEKPYVNDDGQFVLNLSADDLNDGDEITFIFELSGDDPGSKINRAIEVQPAEDGKEVIESSADTNAVAETILEGTTIEWREERGQHYVDVSTVGDVELPLYYGYEGNPVDKNKQLENIKDYDFQARLGEPKDDPDSWQPGDTIQVYITGLGVTAVKEIEVPDDLDGFASNDDENGTESDENAGAESTDNDQSESDNKGSTNNASTEDTVNNDATDEIANTEGTESAVSDSDTGGGIMSPIGWTVIGIVVLALIIGGIIWSKKRRNAS
ncbi:hypothetical protein [Rossellomorea marisflavi]